MTDEPPRRVRPRRRPRLTQVVSNMADPAKAGEDMSTLAPGEQRLLDDAASDLSQNPIDEILDRYAGQTVPLDRAFPDPPPAPAHAVLQAQDAPIDAIDPFPTPRPSAPGNMSVDEAIRHEAKLKLVQRMIMRSATVEQMATALQSTQAEVQRLRVELKNRFRDEAGRINMLSHVGETLSFYDEVRGLMLKRADTQTGINHSDRARYTLAALAAENSKHKFLTTIGFYDNANVRPAVTETDEDVEIAALADALKALVDPDAFVGSVGAVLEGEALPIKPDDPADNITLL